MKITEFKVPEPEPIPEPTMAEELLAEYEEFDKPPVLAEPASVIVEVDELEEEMRIQFEAAYSGNIGMMEVMEFYKIATPKIRELFKRLVDAHKNKEAWQLVQKVTGTDLVGQEFHEDTMEWERDPDHSMVNPMPIIDDDDVYGFMDDVDSELAELIPNRANLAGKAYGNALEKVRHKVGTVQEVPINQIVSTEKYLVKGQINALVRGIAKSSSQMPILYKDGNTYYPGDGNHRIAADYISKKNSVKGLVLDAQEILGEGVGIIIKGVNTTADVDENSTKREAAKLGLTVDKGGIPPLLRTNGKTKTPSNVMEGIKQLDELKMAPGYLQKEVNKIIHSARPRIGLEFEVIFPAGEGEEGNPDIHSSTTFDDIKEFFGENGDDDFSEMLNLYQNWLDDKQNEWAEGQAAATLNTPTDEDYDKKEFMINDYVHSEDADDAIRRITDDEEDTEITEDIAIDTIARADQIFKARGPADEWPTPPLTADPYIVLYYEIFVEDKEEAHSFFASKFNDEFYNSEMTYSDNEYSIGSYLQSMHLNSMGDVFREWSESLYWTGGAMYDGEFDENLAQSVADDLTQDMGIETDVGNGYIDDQAEVDYSTWHVTSDESINPNNENDSGMEIVTSVMDYADGIQDVEEFISYLHDKGAYTNDTTGLHINVSMGNISHGDLDYAKLVVMLGDSHILKQFGREFNEFAQHSLVKLGEMMDETQGFQRDKEAKAKSYAILMSKMKTNLNNVVSQSLGKLHIDKYSSVGLKDNRIEFRSAGGSDYLNNFQAILDLINRFIVAYAVAADPEAHKKEYGKKLYKLASNVGQGHVPKSAMTLFAGFNAGIISKEDLIKHLKAKRVAAQAQADYDKTVDTGEPRGIPAVADLESAADAIEIIAKKYHYTNAAAYHAWEQGYGTEKTTADNDKMAFARTYNNLIRDVNYYSGPEETGF